MINVTRLRYGYLAARTAQIRSFNERRVPTLTKIETIDRTKKMIQTPTTKITDPPKKKKLSRTAKRAARARKSAAIARRERKMREKRRIEVKMAAERAKRKRIRAKQREKENAIKLKHREAKAKKAAIKLAIRKCGCPTGFPIFIKGNWRSHTDSHTVDFKRAYVAWKSLSDTERQPYVDQGKQNTIKRREVRSLLKPKKPLNYYNKFVRENFAEAYAKESGLSDRRLAAQNAFRTLGIMHKNRKGLK
eukprot:TRINITY_DN6021_c0_g1_i3.p1 TRINITY_DN6021_c0_g1~~TRINITY_DN6021_c0_g1_i3.p1  ORF type:complete len:248 (+),score=4.21 TRINITY_DN6021_c0_g1_i3:88-831(+)